MTPSPIPPVAPRGCRVVSCEYPNAACAFEGYDEVCHHPEDEMPFFAVNCVASLKEDEPA